MQGDRLRPKTSCSFFRFSRNETRNQTDRLKSPFSQARVETAFPIPVEKVSVRSHGGDLPGPLLSSLFWQP